MRPSHDSVVPLHRPAIPVGSVQGTLALDLTSHDDAEVHDPPRLVADVAGRSAHVVPIDRRRRAGLEHWSWRYAQAAVEIAGGDRPVSQLVRWTSPRVYDDLARRAQLVTRAARPRPGQLRVQAVRPQVLGVHTCFVTANAVEVSAHIRYGQRSRAVAMRFEIRGERWICTALEFA